MTDKQFTLISGMLGVIAGALIVIAFLMMFLISKPARAQSCYTDVQTGEWVCPVVTPPVRDLTGAAERIRRRTQRLEDAYEPPGGTVVVEPVVVPEYVPSWERKKALGVLAEE